MATALDTVLIGPFRRVAGIMRRGGRGSATGFSRCGARIVSGLACCLACVTGPEAAPSPEAASITCSATGDLEVCFIDGTLTVRAREARLRDILREIAKVSGLTVVLQERLDESMSLTIEQRGLPEAIRRILRDHDFTLLYAPGSASEGRAVAAPGWLWVLAETEAGDQHERIAPAGSVEADRQAQQRVAAVLALSDSDDPLAQLEQALGDPAREVREAAMDLSLEIGGEIGVQALSRALADADPELREDAVYALGEIGGETAAAMLRLALADPILMVRQAATETLDALATDVR